MNDENTVVRRALLSVSDKSGITELARELAALGVELISTGSTAKAIRQAGIAVTEVAAVTGFPEILDGRVKTLHPAIHAGILADRDVPAHLDTLDEHGIEPIDLVVVNLYPFAETVARAGVTREEVIEQIDVGGPTMLRAAAKNHAHVGVVVDPADYVVVVNHLTSEGGLAAGTRAELAAKAFDHTASYDAQIAAWFESGRDFPDRYTLSFRKVSDLRYGENAHQAAAWYASERRPSGLASAEQLGGKQLSFNNLVDTDAAWMMANDFADPCVAIVKHTNPAGLATAGSVAEAYPKALAGDPVSAFGGIVAANRDIDAETARRIADVFTEVVIAPGFSDEARQILGEKSNLRLLRVARRSEVGARVVRSIDGGLLVQDLDDLPEAPESWEVPTRAKPDDVTIAELTFAWRVCKHVKSNAIVLTRDRATVGVGAGQMSRVDSVRLAVEKSGDRHRGSVLASDAFFPFRDGPDVALDAGVRAIIQPGGSRRDDETIAACDERGVPMVFTGRRHFRH